MPDTKTVDGPVSPLFTPIELDGNASLDAAGLAAFSENARRRVQHAPQGDCVCWGVPFRVDRVVAVAAEPLTVRWPAIQAPWLAVMHTADTVEPALADDGLVKSRHGRGYLADHVADYVLLYADGSEARAAIRRQHQIGACSRGWGANCFQAVGHRKPQPNRTLSEQPNPGMPWGPTQFRVTQPDILPWMSWLWGWENPHPDREIVGMRIEPNGAGIVVSAITAGEVAAEPFRWETRRKALMRLPEGATFTAALSEAGESAHIRLDLGQVISVQRRTVYPKRGWETTENNRPPQMSETEVLVEYTAHPAARFHLPGGATIPVAEVERGRIGPIAPVRSATQRVCIRVVDLATGKPVAVKLHVHGEAGEYLQPLDRHRIPNAFWYEDWSVDYVNAGKHVCTYIPGETTIDLPLGRVYVEVSKGFEVAPLRETVRVTRATEELTFSLERVLPWRERGWVTADTHVHFLSPTTAHLEGAAEGVNVVNLLASQWGELMTNVGDFDGRMTHGAIDTGGDGEFLVRVGTENRQHVMGHISLIGYSGPPIVPMTVGGPDESALGDAVDVLLTDWARQCHRQGGIVVVPHFPNPRAEHAAAIVHGDVDAVEMTSWGNLYGGIDPYSLCDWYRYLNCGHFVAAVGGTDKMAASTAVGAVRTYARIPDDRAFDYDAWMDAVRAGQTFVTYGPLLDLTVDGQPMGSRMPMTRSGGTVDVEWQVASVTLPMTRVDLVVNGEVRESVAVDRMTDAGHWSVKVDRSAWIAMIVRGAYPDRPEMIGAHSSPVMIDVAGRPFFSADDARSIMEQIEGALAYLDVLGTRARTPAYRRMRLVLTGAHRAMHNRMHRAGVMHDHTVDMPH